MTNPIGQSTYWYAVKHGERIVALRRVRWIASASVARETWSYGVDYPVGDASGDGRGLLTQRELSDEDAYDAALLDLGEVSIVQIEIPADVGAGHRGGVSTNELNPGWSEVLLNDNVMAVVNRAKPVNGISVEKWTFHPDYPVSYSGLDRKILGVNSTTGKAAEAALQATAGYRSQTHSVSVPNSYTPTAASGTYYSVKEGSPAVPVGLLYVDGATEQWWFFQGYAPPGGTTSVGPRQQLFTELPYNDVKGYYASINPGVVSNHIIT